MKNLRAIPKFFKAKRTFNRPVVEDRTQTTLTELERAFPEGSIPAGASIGITVGSRGIVGIAEVAKACVDFLKKRGATPFILPAMGSHGGATDEGQRSLIAHYGVTEESMGCPIHAQMATRSLGQSPEGLEVFMAESALEADGVLLLNRVKPHTDYSGPLESGLTKISAIGLGKLEGAGTIHSRIFDLGLGKAIKEAADMIFSTGKIIGGVALLENAYHETAKIKAMPHDTLFAEEEELLKEAYTLMGKLPILDLDLLAIDEMGKNISGSGNDTNIIGRCVYGYISGTAWQEGMPEIQRIFVRTLTEESDGNAVGLGLVDFTTPKFMAQVNMAYTQLNAFTSRAPLGARVPLVLDTDELALKTAITTCLERPDGPRAIYIKNTLSLEDIYLSEALLSEAQGIENLEILSEAESLAIDSDGWIKSPFL